MRFNLEVDNIRDLIHSAGLTIDEVAQRLGRSESVTRQKLKGERSLFLDEVGAIAAAITDAGRVKVSEGTLLKLLGRGRVRVRGFVD